jgi:hypothetical protein
MHGWAILWPMTAHRHTAIGLFEQVMTHGGFMVSGIEAVRHLHDDATDDKGAT